MLLFKPKRKLHDLKGQTFYLHLTVLDAVTYVLRSYRNNLLLRIQLSLSYYCKQFLYNSLKFFGGVWCNGRNKSFSTSSSWPRKISAPILASRAVFTFTIKTYFVYCPGLWRCMHIFCWKTNYGTSLGYGRWVSQHFKNGMVRKLKWFFGTGTSIYDDATTYTAITIDSESLNNDFTLRKNKRRNVRCEVIKLLQSTTVSFQNHTFPSWIDTTPPPRQIDQPKWASKWDCQCH